MRSEIGLIETDYDTKSFAEFTVKDLMTVRDRLSVAAQKDHYVNRIATESYSFPGWTIRGRGHRGRACFLTLDIAVIAGTLVAAYYLLPADLRFDRVNYFGDSASTISNAWNGHSFTDFLPMIGAVAGGFVIDQIVRHFASTHARREATRAVDLQRVTFTPQIGIGFMGFDLRY